MKITISGIGGVGKGTVAKLLAEKLGYENFSGGDFFRIEAEKLGMNIYDFDEFVKKDPEYDKKLDLKQKVFGESNKNFILESRLGWFFIPDSIKIKLFCEEEERLNRIFLRDGTRISDGRIKENERLKSINQRYLKLYDIKDFQDKNNFDLVIDTTNISPKEVVEKVLIFIKNML